MLTYDKFRMLICLCEIQYMTKICYFADVQEIRDCAILYDVILIFCMQRYFPQRFVSWSDEKLHRNLQ